MCHVCSVVFHVCALYAWVEGVRYLKSRKPDLTIKDAVGCDTFLQFVVISVTNNFSFEGQRFIGLE